MMLLGGLQGLSAFYGKGSQNSTAKDTANKESTVSAGRTVSIESGKDTDIIGSHVKAEQVTANVAGNLHIESEQDGKEYHEEGKQIGTSLGNMRSDKEEQKDQDKWNEVTGTESRGK